MAFPKDSLTEGEEVKLHLHPHGILLFFPMVSLVIGIAIGVVGLFFAWAPPLLIGLGVVALAWLIWRTFIPWVGWRSTHFVFTTKRLLVRTGVLSREERDISYQKINDVKSTQSLFGRMIGAGTITVESAGDHSQEQLKWIPNVIHVKNVLQQLVEADDDKRTLDDGEFNAGISRLEQALGTQHGQAGEQPKA